MTQLAGYIVDRRCPADPTHGNVFDMHTGGYFCSHSDHHKPLTKSFWTEDEFQDIKSLPTPPPPPNGNLKIKKARRRR